MRKHLGHNRNLGRTRRNPVLPLLLPLVLIALILFGRNYGSAFVSRIKVNAALEANHAVMEFFAPQVVYAGDGMGSSFGDDLYAAVLPALSYYDRILWYESLEQENYQFLAAKENAKAAEDAAGGSGAGNSGTGSSDAGGTGTGDLDTGSSGIAGSGAGDSGAGSSGTEGTGTDDSGEVSSGQLSEDERSEVAAQSGDSSGSASEGSSGSSADGNFADGNFADGNFADGNFADGSSTDGNSSDGSSAGGSSSEESSSVTVLADISKSATVDRNKLEDFDYLKSAFYQVDSTTSISSSLLDASGLLAADMTLEKSEGDEPQILIYHTHSQEGYADSVEGDPSTTVVRVGEYLTEILTEQYGYRVLHHMGEYDLGDRDHAYTNAAPALEDLLEEYPSIQVVIDLHRDGVSESTHLVTEINGKPTAQIMFFNGISHTTTLGDISWLPNSYIKENLAFSLQLQLAAAEYYPGFTRKIYIKGYRYNMHYVPQSLLVEVGAQTNTLEEAMNAMEPLAAILDYVLSGASRGE